MSTDITADIQKIAIEMAEQETAAKIARWDREERLNLTIITKENAE